MVMTDDEKLQFVKTADPYQVVERFPFEYTINIRLGPTKWHTTAALMSPMEQQVYRASAELRDLESQQTHIERLLGGIVV